jgi:FkbM family methyltransferase
MSNALRTLAGTVLRAVRPSPAVADWRRACRTAAGMPRYTPGEIRFRPYTIEFTDLLSICPQWHDLFVRDTHRFSALTQSPRILDCGANVGLASLYFKRLYPRARITAFEADPVIAAACSRNLARNGCGDVVVRAEAVWTVAGTVAFAVEGADSGAVTSGEGAIQVPAVRLRDLLAAEPCDLLKLDVEGAEGALLEDCRDVLHNVRAMIVDVHEINRAERQSPRLLSLLHEAQFDYVVSDLVPMPWRGTVPALTPFAGAADVWACTVRAWRRA